MLGETPVLPTSPAMEAPNQSRGLIAHTRTLSTEGTSSKLNATRDHALLLVLALRLIIGCNGPQMVAYSAIVRPCIVVVKSPCRCAGLNRHEAGEEESQIGRASWRERV